MVMAVSMTASRATTVAAIVPAFAIAALIGFTVVPATMVTAVVWPPAVITPLIVTVPIVPVAPVSAIPVVAPIVPVANL